MGKTYPLYGRANNDPVRDIISSQTVYYNYRHFPSRVQLPLSPDWDEYLCRELHRLTSLPVGWDFYGSPPVDPEIAYNARIILAQLWQLNENSRTKPDLKQPFLVPISGGALQAEWHFGEKVVEIFFDYDLKVEASFLDRQDDSYDEDHDLEVKDNSIDLTQVMKWFAGIDHAEISSEQAA